MVKYQIIIVLIRRFDGYSDPFINNNPADSCGSLYPPSVCIPDYEGAAFPSPVFHRWIESDKIVSPPQDYPSADPGISWPDIFQVIPAN